MRVFYGFQVKNNIKNLYEDNENNLYLLFRNIYFMRECDKDYACNLYKQIIDPINKNYVNKDLFIKLHSKYMYSKQDNKHIINNLYSDEVSILIIKNSYVIITANNNKSTFFNILTKYCNNLFICDFANYDYFFLDKLKNLA